MTNAPLLEDRIEALFLPGTAGPIFILFFDTPDGVTRKGGVVLVPPFAEEMSKARRMYAMQARALAASGYSALLVDLYGTGDSAGDFGDARWEIWQADIDTVCQWLHSRGVGRISLIGLRLGALLAMDYVHARPGEIAQVVLWQPVVSGKTALAQFVRMHVVAAMMGRQGERVRADDLWRRLRDGISVEVAGYTLAPELAQAVESLSLAQLVPPSSCTVHWFEVHTEPRSEVSPAARQVLDAWRRQGVGAVATSVAGPAFWSSVEIVEAPALVEATTGAFAPGAD